MSNQLYGINSYKGVTCPSYEYNNVAVTCHSQNNQKVIQGSNANVEQRITAVQRMVNDIKYSHGGTTNYGNTNLVYNYSRITFLGRTEGQPGGMVGPLKNKF
jgi:hypothetical protein